MANVAVGRELYHCIGWEVPEINRGGSFRATPNSLSHMAFQKPFVLFQVSACLLVAAWSGYQIGGVSSFVALLGTYFSFDLLSGMTHYCLDDEKFNHLALIGLLCQTFQHHHRDTTFIW